jgi:hypothetical protein
MPRKRKAVPLAFAVAAVIAGAAFAAIPDSAGVIHGCYTNRGGILRVIDPSAGAKCTSLETALSWSQQGPRGNTGAQGPAGPQGAQGPQGQAGTIGRLDDLEGIPCKGVNSKPANVHLSYGTGIEAPVTLLCITHLVRNPGAFTMHLTGGTFAVPLRSFTLPSGGQLSGEIDLGGKITVPASGFQMSDVPFEWQENSSGFLDVHVIGTTSFASSGITGFLDPAAGTASLSGDAHASVTFTATASILGATTQLYSGTCTFGSEASPLSLTLTTDPPGVPYSQSTGAVTLSAGFSAPSLDGCSPALPDGYAFLLNILAGSDRLTLSGTTDPIITAP